MQYATRVSVVVLVMVSATACGLGIRGTASESSDSQPTLPAAQPSDAPSVPASDAGAPCESGTCTPSNAADATSAAPPLACKSSDDCGGKEHRCCYDPSSGSTCAKSCGSGATELCRLGTDDCDGECVAIDAPPASGIGHCAPPKD